MTDPCTFRDCNRDGERTFADHSVPGGKINLCAHHAIRFIDATPYEGSPSDWAWKLQEPEKLTCPRCAELEARLANFERETFTELRERLDRFETLRKLANNVVVAKSGELQGAVFDLHAGLNRLDETDFGKHPAAARGQTLHQMLNQLIAIEWAATRLVEFVENNDHADVTEVDPLFENLKKVVEKKPPQLPEPFKTSGYVYLPENADPHANPTEGTFMWVDEDGKVWLRNNKDGTKVPHPVMIMKSSDGEK